MITGNDIMNMGDSVSQLLFGLDRTRETRMEAHRAINQGIAADPGFQVPFPLTVLLTVSSRCNLRCVSCDLGKRQDSYATRNLGARDELDEDLYCRMIDSFGPYKPEVFFVGVEPLLWGPLARSIRYAAEKGLFVELTTNGLLLEKHAEALLKSGLGRINVSMDGHTPELHDAIRGVRGAFDRSIAGLTEASRIIQKLHLDTELVINCVVSEYNYRHLPEIASFWSKQPITALALSLLQYVSSSMAGHHNAVAKSYPVSCSSVFDLDPASIDGTLLVAKIREARENYPRLCILPAITDAEIERYHAREELLFDGYQHCYYPWKYIMIMPDGSALPNWRCFSGSLGNIQEKNLKEIWDDRPIARFRGDLFEMDGCFPACTRCSGIYCSQSR